jgi:uncharacterized sulfatase
MRISEITIRDYFKALFLCYLYVLIIRSLEYYWVASNHIVENLLGNEIIGLIVDFLIVNTLSVLILLLQHVFRNCCRRLANVIIIFFIVLICLFHILTLKYFVYILRPVDQFLFKYSVKELFFTISTAEVSFPVIIILIAIFISIAVFLPRLTVRKQVSPKWFRWYMVFILLSVPLSFYAVRKIENDNDDIRKNIRINKSVYFYKRTYAYLSDLHKDLDLTAEHIHTFQDVFSGKEYLTEEYPFLHKQNADDVIGDYFTSSETLPNFVFIIVEGLGQRFMDVFHGVRLMPYLDSLAGRSLYWDRFFTTAERSFAVVPSITGSLPYGKNGFTALDQLPRHLTLLSILKKYGYRSNFFYGQGAWFDRKDRFLKTNNIDLIFDKSCYSPEYEKVRAMKGKFFWGYQDRDLFQQSLEVLDTLPPGPRTDLYFTGSMHSPFPVDDPDYYYDQLDRLISVSDLSPQEQKYIDKYSKYLISVLFFDQALEQFMEQYAKRDGYNRTIFIITGDHPMTEIPIESSIKRYHVPLIIYSPLLKRTKRIHSTGSHLDIYPTLMAFLRDKHKLSIPDMVSNLGYCLDTAESFRNAFPIPLMDGNREIIDYLENGSFLSQGKRALRINHDLDMSISDDPNKLKNLQGNLDAFIRVNLFACMNDRLIPDSIYFRNLCYNRISSTHKNLIEISESTKFSNIQSVVCPSNHRELYFDISYTIDYDPGVPLPVGVVQINNDADSMIHWQSFGLMDTDTDMGLYTIKRNVKIETAQLPDSMLDIRSYFWNNDNGRLLIRDLDLTLYQLSDCN